MPPMLKQSPTTAITATHAVCTMFAMAAMLGQLMAHLKMPRLDAYVAGAARTSSSITKSEITRSNVPARPAFVRREGEPPGNATG